MGLTRNSDTGVRVVLCLQQQHEADIAEHKGLLDASFVDAEAM